MKLMLSQVISIQYLSSCIFLSILHMILSQKISLKPHFYLLSIVCLHIPLFHRQIRPVNSSSPQLRQSQSGLLPQLSQFLHPQQSKRHPLSPHQLLKMRFNLHKLFQMHNLHFLSMKLSTPFSLLLLTQLILLQNLSKDTGTIRLENLKSKLSRNRL